MQRLGFGCLRGFTRIARSISIGSMVLGHVTAVVAETLVIDSVLWHCWRDGMASGCMHAVVIALNGLRNPPSVRSQRMAVGYRCPV
jgi:hypothetical protein